MAPDVIDLVSSSPLLRTLSPAIPPGSGTNRPTLISGTSGLPQTFELYSDDFDTTIDFDEPLLVETSGNKRRRITPSSRVIEADACQSTLPPLDRPNDQRQFSAIGDAIELSSSSDTEAPCQTQLSILAVQRTSKRALFHSPHTREAPQTPNPFASSQDPLHIAKDLGRGKRAISTPGVDSDPFATSPLTSCNLPSKDHPSKHDIITEVQESIGGQSRVHWDPISSSAPEIYGDTKERFTTTNLATEVIDLDSDSRSGSGSDNDELPDIEKLGTTKFRGQRQGLAKRSHSDIIPSKARSRPSNKAVTSDKRRVDKEQRLAEKEAENERKRQQKQADKEAKLREKELAAALAEVNKVRTNKKVSTPEMIADLPASLKPTLKVPLEKLLERLDVQHTTWDSPVDNVIKWRRKVKSRFVEEMGHWEPIPLRIDPEAHVAVIITGDDFVQLVLSDELEDHIGQMTTHFGNQRIIYLIEGLNTWLRKNRNIRNRQFASGVRTNEAPPPGRRQAASQQYVQEDLIEDALLQLQVIHNAFIHHTTTPNETVEWIGIFTQQISTIPYKKIQDMVAMGAGFCMDSGQVKTGDSVKGTYIQLLQEIARVTPPIAYGISTEFGTVTQLIEGLEREGPSRLQNIKKSADKNGSFSDRTIGQAVSKRIHKVFTGTNELSTDV